MHLSHNTERFGLPLSLVEALEADPSDNAALLASYLSGAAGAARRPIGDMLCEVFSLDQLLEDPLIQMVMASDHLVEDDVRAVMPVARRPGRLAQDQRARLAA